MSDDRPIRQMVARNPEPRHLIDCAALMVIEEGHPLPARLINLSRHGFRLRLPQTFAAGQALRLEVAGWPRLAARVVWSQDGRTGCMFDDPPDQSLFAMMSLMTNGREADGL